MFNLIAHKTNAEYSDYYNAYLFIETNESASYPKYSFLKHNYFLISLVI